MAGSFNTTFVTEIILKLPELNHSAKIYAKCYLANKLSNYDLILSRDILCKLGIIFNFQNKTITWQEVIQLELQLKELNTFLDTE